MLFSHDDKATAGEPKGLQRLRRQDLVQLLVDQIHENDELRADISERDAVVEELSSQDDRLKARLDDKDEQIEHLKDKLNLKDEQIEHLKEKLNDKDAQIERLKAKLNEKDALIDRLKGKLDDKDRVLEDIYMVVRELAGAEGAEVRTQHILTIESILADHFLLSRRAPSGNASDQAQDEETRPGEDVPGEEVSE